MPELTALERVQDFFRRASQYGIESTGHRVINYTGVLYNVIGSTHDPEEVEGYEGSTWKNLLVNAAGLGDSPCYVTNEVPPNGTSHPNFSVGGHMTSNEDGSAPVGGDAYLMPLCSWHNHSARNGKAFEHTETKIILLSGYMQGELAATFELRRSGSPEPFSLLYLDDEDGIWKHKDLPEDEAVKIGSSSFTHHALLEKPTGSSTLHQVREINLPDM